MDAPARARYAARLKVMCLPSQNATVVCGGRAGKRPAAEELGLTTSTVSHRIRILETRLVAPLPRSGLASMSYRLVRDAAAGRQSVEAVRAWLVDSAART